MRTEIKRSETIAIPLGTDGYPTEWLCLADAPETLYAFGDISLLNKRKFTAVGSRRTPVNVLKITAGIAKELSEQFVLVTGIADGGDSAIIEGALAGSGRVICVLAGGFSALPQSNLALISKIAERGLLLSPYPFEMEVRSFSYEYRNKLLAALGEGVLVTGAAEKSGALITAKYAKEYGKKIFAIPYSLGVTAGTGCNKLLKEGGYLTESAGDIYRAFGIQADEGKGKPKVALTADEQKLYEAVKELSDGHVSEISAKAGIPAFKARGMLSALEVKGLITPIGGNRYSAT